MKVLVVFMIAALAATNAESFSETINIANTKFGTEVRILTDQLKANTLANQQTIGQAVLDDLDSITTEYGAKLNAAQTTCIAGVRVEIVNVKDTARTALNACVDAETTRMDATIAALKIKVTTALAEINEILFCVENNPADKLVENCSDVITTHAENLKMLTTMVKTFFDKLIMTVISTIEGLFKCEQELAQYCKEYAMLALKVTKCLLE